MTQEIWISEILIFDFLENENQVSQVVYFRLKKQTGKNVADITCKVKHLGVPSPSDNFLSEVSFNKGMLHNPSCLEIKKIIPPYNREFKLLDAWVSQYLAFFATKRWRVHQRDTNQSIYRVPDCSHLCSPKSSRTI